MNEIEWQETSEYQPAQKSLRSFGHRYGIHLDTPITPGGVVAFMEIKALKGLHDFLSHDVHREHGGVLVGTPYFDPTEDCYFVVVKAAIPAQETEGSPVHLQFTPETWSGISGIIEESFPDQVIVGWYHSHPGLGVFMSGTDRATQAAFFDHPWSLAAVIDPVAKKPVGLLGKNAI